MRKNNQLFLLFLITAFLLSACNLQFVENTPDPNAANLELTAIVQRMLIDQAGQQGNAGTATFTPEVGNLPATEEVVVPAAVLPPATGDITVTVSVATNCRTGPGQNFKIVYGMPVGQVAKVVAKNSYSGYWIIEIPGQAGQTCWLWGQYAVINGDTATLKEVVTPTSPAPTITNTPKATNTVQPTATNTTAASLVPSAPSNLTGTVICNPTQFPNLIEYAISLTWVDNSNNEDNFNIFSTAWLDPVSANTTSYSLTALNVPGTILTAVSYTHLIQSLSEPRSEKRTIWQISIFTPTSKVFNFI